ncbi:hypothetical protein Mal52_55030 [Symmachiella dynata]|uniref:Uncharacterized protein n=1 Tax=Symmachiella dynata TaxID=2527995 RepID=A0A517ZX21_9PLAN|nr:hypothetical protein [Symmachiella dynata]QDU46975.1 hypothetical protein Mal52_55030 [Symmachiella dynata]
MPGIINGGAGRYADSLQTEFDEKMQQLEQQLQSAASLPAQEDLKRQIAETEARHRETLKSLCYNLY